MCGIAGIISLDGEPVQNVRLYLDTMNDIQAHRGPDDEGIWIHPNGHIGFGHRRLSIIDLNTGKQPMVNSAGTAICYNGEIYNYIELRDELKDGYNFRTTSDTEVILAAYEKWGINCVESSQRHVQFCHLGRHRASLFCARDRFGIKPFYYAID